MTRALPLSSTRPDAAGAAARDLLAARRLGAARWRRALDRASLLSSRPPASDGADLERRELLAAIVEELRGPDAAAGSRTWAGLLAHLAATPTPSATLY